MISMADKDISTSQGKNLNTIQSATSRRTDSTPAIRAPRILLVDDDYLTLVLLAKGMREHGYEVDEAPSADIALKLVENGSYDLGILDINMPGMSGIELAAVIHRTRRLPILFLSANIDQYTVASATAENPVGYVVKPINVARLIPSVEAALASSKVIEKKQETCEQLTEALKKKRIISTAVGVLLAHTHSEREAANQALRKLARDNHRKIEDVAESIVTSAEILHSAEAPLRQK